MRAVVLTETDAPLTVVTDHPEPCGPGGELIDVTACGVCHSDIHVVDGDYRLNGKSLWIRGSNLVHEWEWASVIDGKMMQSSPSFQFAGVATW